MRPKVILLSEYIFCFYYNIIEFAIETNVI